LLDPNDSASPLMQLADNASELSRLWEQEHDQHVVARLLEIMKGEFSEVHVKAFTRFVLNNTDAATVARELHITEAVACCSRRSA
jgi:RNA polymerase sigma-70 factor (ECF subfamily)